MSDDLSRLIVDFEKAGDQAERESYATLKREAGQMKDDWRARVRGTRGLPGLERAVSYDMQLTGLRSVTTEVGYDKSGQGNLGNIAEYGSSRHGPIRPVGDVVLQAGADRLEKYLADLGSKIL